MSVQTSGAVYVEMSREKFDSAVDALGQFMDHLQAEGRLSRDELLAIVAYTFGFWIGANGGHPTWHQPLDLAMPPMVVGWRAGRGEAASDRPEEVH